MTTIPETPSPYQENAQAIRLDLHRLMQDVPGLALLTPQQRRKFQFSGHVDDDYLRRMTLLIDAHPDIATLSHITSAEIRDHLNFYGAYQGVGEEMMLNGRKMADTLTAERARIAEGALRAQKIARSVNEPAGRESLVPHLEAIDREFSRGRRKRAVAKPDDPATAKKKPEVKP